MNEDSKLKNSEAPFISEWEKWGPYVSERAWGTVREDYSPDGRAWDYFPYDLSISKAYRWGEDGIAGICDRYQVLCFSPAFWNGKDKMLKERLFGLSSSQGNHGEDVKECYYYLDNGPTHSYMKYLYKYPQAEFPYDRLYSENQKRTTLEPEFELVDTGVFEKNRYFDVFIEYIKVDSEDLFIRIEAINRGDVLAELHIIPQLWFRNQWSWDGEKLPPPTIHQIADGVLLADDQNLPSPVNLSFDYHLGHRYLYGPPGGEALFTENQTNDESSGYFKDAFHRSIIHGEKEAVNLKKTGSKAALHYSVKIEPGASFVLTLRLSNKIISNPFDNLDYTLLQRKAELDSFYETVHPKSATEEEKQIQREALSGMLWNKQIYLFDVNLWLKGDSGWPSPAASRYKIRNAHWAHLNSMRIMSMPDKWEYPWFAAWDHAFHTITLALVDLHFAKEQLWLLLFDQFQHPNGQIPAYEWEFSDLNPPVQAWAVLRLYAVGKEKHGVEDREFLEKCFHKLLLNFTWWVNRVDTQGNNVFEGGFLGLDNIAVFDRSLPLPGGVKLQQSDGTGWMAILSLNLMRIALILAENNPAYESLATKFFQHYVYIADAMKKQGNKNYEMWTEEDGFFHDVLTYPDGRHVKFRVRSLVGIIPLFAVDVLTQNELARFPEFRKNFNWFMENRPSIVHGCVISDKEDYILALMDLEKLERVLKYVWDKDEFRSEFGLRSLSKYHDQHPFIFEGNSVGYEPAESLSRLKGGNSNWRGPIWLPATYLLTEALKKFASVLKGLQVQVGEEEPIGLFEMALCFEKRTLSIFKKNEMSERPLEGKNFPFKNDPLWDYILFYEYYDAETGKGLGASHQTGWTGLVANMIDEIYRCQK